MLNDIKKFMNKQTNKRPSVALKRNTKFYFFFQFIQQHFVLQNINFKFSYKTLNN